jgi:multiple sugar transport system ATP-binding protein
MATVQAAGRAEIVVGLRPEAVELATADTAGAMPLLVTLLEQLGADSYVYGTLASDDPDRDKPFVVRVDGRFEPKRGETVYIAARGEIEHVFEADSGSRLA